MNVYVYKARSKDNKTIRGKVEANDEREASTLLRERGLFVISITQFSDSIIDKLVKSSKVSSGDIVNLTRQLSTMITAGLPLTDALGLLSAQSKPTLQHLTDTVRRDIEGGSTFASALEKHRNVFGAVYVALIEAGESAGVLDKVLARLADNLEKEKEFKAKTRGALIYPAIVMSAMGIVAVVMMIFVIPKLTVMYEDFGAELPAPTKILMGASDITRRFWYVFAGIIVACIFSFRAFRKTPQGRYKVDQLMLKMPIFGPIRSMVALVELTRTLSMLLNAGISLLEGLEIVRGAMDNLVYSTALEKISNDVEKGQSLAMAISHRTEFPLLMSQMVSVGEETGKLDEVLMRVSTYFESESEHLVKGLTTAMEPLIMIVLGVGVGFLVIAIIMPIYSLTSQF